MRNVGVRLLCAVPSVLLVVSVMNPGAAAEGASPEPPAADASRAAAPLGKDCEAALSTTLKSLDPCGIRFTFRLGAAAVDEEGYCVLDRDQFYYRLTWPPAANRAPVMEEMSYDGHTFYDGVSRKKGTSIVTRYLGDNPGDQVAAMRRVDVPYLEAAGFVLPATIGEWKAPALDSAVLRCAAIGRLTKTLVEGSILRLQFEIPEPVVSYAQRVDLDAMASRSGGIARPNVKAQIEALRRARTLDPMRRVEFWLFSNKGYCVSRREDRTRDGRLIETIDCDDFALFGDSSVWLPRHCLRQGYVRAPQVLGAFSQAPVSKTDIQLQELSHARPEGISFKLAYGSGSAVVERSTLAAKQSPQGQISYLEPEDAKALRDAANQVKGGWSKGRILLILNAMALVVMGGVLARRYWTTRARR
jgi:hypothetical protein